MSPAAVAYLASSHQNLMAGGDSFIISDDIHYSCDPSPFHHHHHHHQRQHETDFEVQCCPSYKYDNQSLLINNYNESDINIASTQEMKIVNKNVIRLEAAHDHHFDNNFINKNNTCLLTEMYDPTNDEKESNLFKTISTSSTSLSSSTSAQLVFGSHKKAENALKLILLSISYIIYMFTWNNHDFQQPHHQSLTIKTNDNNDYCSNIPPILNDTIHSLQNVTALIQLLMKRNALICFPLILISVSFLCEKLFSHQITIKSTDCSTIDNNHHCHNNHDETLSMEKCSTCQRIHFIIDDHHNTNYKKRIIHTELIITLICLLPWRLISKIWGFLNQIQLPILVRRPLFVWYAKTFGCNLDEMENKDLSQYRNLGEFFRRSLAPNFRPISQENGIVSPADGLVVQFEPVSKNGGFIGSIKGIHYSIGNFLGYNCFDESFHPDWSIRENRIQPGNRLYSTVIYLAPGDYHRFHSPTDWTIQHRRHFSGNLLSVKPAFVAKMPNLFAINERVVYYGKWKYGFFSMAAVGATNVGTINVFCDQDLKTNQTWQSNKYLMEKTFDNPIMIQKGDLFGEFNLGSTMVMIYEAPKDHVQFESFIGDKVKYGQLLLRINQ